MSETHSNLGSGVSDATPNTVSEVTEYVNSIMSSQTHVKMMTPCDKGRKRNLSVSGTCDTTNKKIRNDISPDLETLRTPIRAKRNLYKNAPEPAPRTSVNGGLDAYSQVSPSIQYMFDKLSADMNAMYLQLNERFDELMSSLETRITNKVSQLLDKRVNSELSKIKRSVNSEIDTRFENFQESIKAEIATEVTGLREQIKSSVQVPARVDTVQDSGRSLNIVIRNLPESASESTKAKVQGLLRDGLKLPHVKVSNADRKKAYRESKPGVVIASLASKEDKQAVMKAKAKLKSCDQYSSVFIHNDLPPSERATSKNFATILNALSSNDLAMKGSRVVFRNNNTQHNTGVRGSYGDRESRQDRHHGSDGHRGGRSDQYDHRRRDHRYDDESRGGYYSTRSSYNRTGGYNAGRK